MKTKLFYFILFFNAFISFSQHSVAREWNEIVLEHIRDDFARPTVHARNLFHSSVLMYDAWAIFNDNAETVFLGKTFGNYDFEFQDTAISTQNIEDVDEIISYGMLRLLEHRFSNASAEVVANRNNFFSSLGYDASFISTNYSTGSHAALGNYFADQIIQFGLTDGSNESNDYANLLYQPSNEFLDLTSYTDNDFIDPDRWQPLAFDVFVDQSGNVIPTSIPDFLSPEWGQVVPFALNVADLEILNNGFDSYVYNDPGAPVYIGNENGLEDEYKWNFSLVVSWSAHLDPADETLIDISPNAMGNITSYPTTFEEYQAFYDFTDGSDPGQGYTVNPITNEAYEPQMVKRADYARVLAEFWADGPDSETPPGHWFTILNYVSDHPLLVKKVKGEGDEVGDLEWDVKAYLSLAGAMHDAAVNTWGIKGYYDYVRPISAIRYMAAKGQSSDESLDNYDPHGLPLIEGLIEVIEIGDELAGTNNENVGEIKVKSWKGPDYINDPTTDVAGVDWIMAKKWWSYQRSTFVTPPFAGYLSGHSVFSAAAAKVLELFTGDAFFPGGMGTFDAEQDTFLFFEKGPSESLTLQWATYKDASDQTSLSRIWGGIHPPIDDIRGRILGQKIGEDAFGLAETYFGSDDGITLSNDLDFGSIENDSVFPIPFSTEINYKSSKKGDLRFKLFSITGTLVLDKKVEKQQDIETIAMPNLESGVYFLHITDSLGKVKEVNVVVD